MFIQLLSKFVEFFSVSMINQTFDLTENKEKMSSISNEKIFIFVSTLGANRANSVNQLVNVESGATTRNGPSDPSWTKLQMNEITWIVLPRRRRRRKRIRTVLLFKTFHYLNPSHRQEFHWDQLHEEFGAILNQPIDLKIQKNWKHSFIENSSSLQGFRAPTNNFGCRFWISFELIS